MSPHIGLNVVFLVPGETGGMETYARELVPALIAERPEWQFTLFVGREAAEWLREELPPTTGRVVLPVSARNRLAWVRGEQQLLPRAARKQGVDLVHSLANTAPVWGNFKRVVTVHDLHYKVVPDAHFGLRGLGMSVLVPAAAKRSQRVIAVSHNTAADIERHLGLGSDRVSVVHNGFGHPPAAPGATLGTRPRERFDLGSRPVLLTLAAKRPHKNLVRLLEALAEIPTERRPVLILPGYPTPHEDELKRRAAELNVSADVRFLGWLSGSDTEGFYALADAFVFPSLYEGFGLPVLEAMARGVPVACSDRSSLPEIAGDAALLFNPESVSEIRSAIESLLADRELAARLSAAGRKRAQEFTWQRCARETVAAYELALSTD